jgi:uncharacterized protein (DUF302 family)
MYAMTVEIALPIDQAIEKLKDALTAEKMGVVSEVNVQAIMKAKLDHDIPPYRMIGICGAGYARRVLEADADMGAMLPCSCAAYEVEGGKTRIAIQDPNVVAGVTDKDAIKTAMAEARVALERVVATLKG